MRTLLTCALVALALGGCAAPQSLELSSAPIAVPETERIESVDEAFETALTVAILADIASAGFMLERGWREKNVILGPRPSAAELAVYGGIVVAGNELLIERIPGPKELRILARIALTGMEFYFTGKNIDAAIRYGQ